LNWEEIRLGEEYAEAWKRFVETFKEIHVEIREDDNQLV